MTATDRRLRVPAASLPQRSRRRGRRLERPAGDPGRRRAALLLAGIAALAFAARLHLLLHGGGLLGIGAYDDGVHYAAGASLIHGLLPYRDFLFLQPPVIVLIAAPFAALGRVLGAPAGLVALRIAFELVGAGNAVLVGLLLRRFGTAAVLTGGLIAAVFLPSVYDERTALLEPLGGAGVLLALLLVARGGPRAALVAGAALGLACGCKIWYVVPALVIAGSARGRRLRVLGGALASGAVVGLPFLLAAPSRMVEDVVVAQLGRNRSADGPLARLGTLLGVHGIRDDTPLPGVDPTLLALLLLAVVAACAVAALRTRGAAVFAVLLAADGLVVMASPSFFAHYAALTAPALALVVGVGAGRLASAVPRQTRLPVALAVLVAVLGLNARHDLARVDRRTPAVALQRAAAPVPGCVVSDDPTLLAVMGLLNRDLDRGCVLRVDPSGYSFGPLKEVADGVQVARVDNARYQAAMLRYLRSGAAFIQVRRTAWLSPATKATLAERPALFAADGFVLRRGTG